MYMKKFFNVTNVFFACAMMFFGCNMDTSEKEKENEVSSSDTIISLIKNSKKGKYDTVLNYSSNKNIIEVTPIYEGKKVGEGIIYKSNFLYQYHYRNWEEQGLFRVNYDSSKKIENIEGDAISVKMASHDTINIGEVLDVNLFLCAPPLFKRKLIYGFVDEERKFKSKDSIELNDETVFNASFMFPETGNFNWMAKLVLENDGKIYTYTSLTPILVVGNGEVTKKVKIKFRKEISEPSIFTKYPFDSMVLALSNVSKMK